MVINKDIPQPTVAEVDALIDENGSRILLADDTPIRVAGEHDETVGATGPTNWWLYGLVGLVIVIVVLVLLQLFRAPVQPGTSATPAIEVTVTPAPQ